MPSSEVCQEESGRMQRRTIAVVNDDPTFIELVRELLEEEGYTTTAQREGPAAVAFVQATMPDLLVLDIRLEQPEGGWVVLKALRADPRTRRLPVIVCSADQPFLRRRAAELEAYGCAVLEKPFQISRLYALVAMMLGSTAVERYDELSQ
jgi:CheY-like chemotaxis protein